MVDWKRVAEMKPSFFTAASCVSVLDNRVLYALTD